MSKIEFQPAFPPQMTPSMPYSSSDFIASRRTKVFLPDQQTTYSFDGNDRLVFTMNSNNEFLDGQNSWIEFDLTVAATGDSLNATQLTQRIIDVGGAHALFRRMQVSLSNGTQIEDVQGYNKLYSIMRLNTMSENHVRYVEAMSGDGMVSDRLEPSPYDGSGWRTVTAVLAEAGINAAGTTLTLAAAAANANALTELADGDVIRISGTVGGALTTAIVRVNGAPAANNTVTIDGHVAAAMTVVTRIQVAKSGSLQTPRFRAASTAAIKLRMKPFSNFLQNAKFVPLMFLKNLQFTFECERGPLAMRLLAAPGNNAGITYTITNPRFVCDLVTPSEPVLQEMLQVYNSDQGIYHPFISFQGSVRRLSAGSGSVTIPSSVRSAKAAILAQYPSACEVVEANSYITDTVSTSVKDLLTEVSVTIGSERFPYGRAIDTADIYNGETFAHLQKALDVHGNVTKDTSLISSDYYAINTVLGVADESRRFVVGIPLARDMVSTGCGVDLISDDVIVEMTKSGAGIQPYLRSWLVHDSAIQISRQSTVVYK